MSPATASRAAARAAVLLLAALLLVGCGRGDEEVRHRFMAMGTLVDVTTWGVPRTEAEEGAREVEALFLALHREWDPWGDGALGRVNQALAAGEDAAPDEDLGALLAEAAALSAASDGLFEPAIATLVKLWGFSREETLPEAPPPADEIAARLAGTRPLAALVGPGGRVSGPPGAQIDLGGFLKGVAVDRGIELLRARGVDHAIVNAGGDLRAIGRRGERPWRIGIRAAREQSILAALEVEGDEAVFTSGDYERYFVHDGRHYHHVLDPRSGYPTAGIVSATVVHRNAGLADAAATALMVAGPDDWPATARALGVDSVMIVHEDGRIELTGALRPRIRFRDEAQERGASVRPLP
ncbi:MAG TPA: FAD:protein FMN transferase [Gammaproteobacteria bacterium]|nr:FAD:protein FMN transferase [Gammaproteobacteria bacterium]